ncbi:MULTISPECIES: thioredoxin family protein [unclassified Gemella]|uniref:thioredoxin family protein n=1 Tax=unclassified Gemella TaxID=2624949 RepID=UPI0010745396|nr:MULTISPECIES: thioredoxin family protein [unclassified Gemella]MBF0710011.1 conjugal transfer protein TraF [Gemella sp. GL1.1]MBF0746090.1 conjugal transfer protein TraF [Gemella sp. 19428wG2_WT2a]NYS27355.1 conjugal transfer protein TraF [Gemella sp. GL1]TFU60381.1 thiol reductase thioredoxin [Gemella sp. WT2a]
MSFFDYIKDFPLITSEQAEEKINKKEELVLFVGKATCSFCLIFAPKLYSVAKKEGITVHFVNSEDFSDSTLSAFRTKYKIKTVPGLLVARNGETKVVCDSSLSEEDITNFIK